MIEWPEDVVAGHYIGGHAFVAAASPLPRSGGSASEPKGAEARPSRGAGEDAAPTAAREPRRDARPTRDERIDRCG